MWQTSLATRSFEPERMDDPDLDAAAHVQALAGLRRLNRASATVRSVWRAIHRSDLGQRDTPLRVLDLACGGGDLAVGLARRARARGPALDVHGADISERALDTARTYAARAGAEVGFVRLDALDADWPDDFDVIVSSLFLHHLSTTDLVPVLARAARAARRLVIMSDLRRSRSGLLLAWAGTRLLSRSPVVHDDGPRSVRAAWTEDELRTAATSAGLDGASIERIWPQRFLLTWSRPQ